MTTIRGVTFDATGTLFHSPRLGHIYSEVLARHGIDVAPAEVRRLVRLVWRELDCASHMSRDRFAGHPQGARGWWSGFLERLCRHLEEPPPSRFAAAELFDRFSRAAAWEPFAEVPAALEGLAAAGLRLAVVSNWDERLPGVLAGLGLAQHFRAVVYSQAAGVEKPHPLIFQTALERLELPAESVLHVGDSRRHDFEGAQAAGLRALLLERAPAGGAGAGAGAAGGGGVF